MRTILLIDDDEMIRVGIADLLELEGYRVLEAVGGIDGLEMARQHRPDLIITDIQMPDISGFEVVERLRREDALGEVPVVFITAFHDPETEVRSRKLTICGYIRKPFSHTTLYEVVADCLH